MNVHRGEGRSLITVTLPQEMGIGFRGSCVGRKDVSVTLRRGFDANEFPDLTPKPNRNYDFRVFRLSHGPVQLYRLVNQPSREHKSIAGVCWRIDLCSR